MATIQEPRYETTVHDGDFEVRHYRSRIVAETEVAKRDWAASGNEGFRRLAAYIFGKNRKRTKLAMTAPVGQRPTPGVELAMTAPVGQRRDHDRWVVSFTMPNESTLATLPEPEDPRVVLRELPPADVAVVRFSGRWTDTNIDRRTQALRRWVASRGLATVGEPEVNRYDPPFKLWFLRRNEVWVAVVRPPSA